MNRFLLASVLFACVSATAFATPASDALFARYTSEGGTTFSAESGRAMWIKSVAGKGGKTHACSDCHGADVTKPGQHANTKKAIKPMALSVNADRYADERKIEKWFKRNCKWTWGRECTAQEKGDFLTYLLGQ